MATADAGKSLRRDLDRGLCQLGQPLDDIAQQKLLVFLQLLERWNKRVNLTAVRDIAAMVVTHLLDSLAIRPWINTGPVIDIGSGAGLPGLPLAIANPERAHVLVDSAVKRCRFLRQAIVELDLDNVRVENSRAEDYRLSPGSIDVGENRNCPVITARAFAALPDLIVAAGHLLASGGVLLAMKGRVPQDEIDALPNDWQLDAVHKLNVPGIAAQRHLLVVTRKTASQ